MWGARSILQRSLYPGDEGDASFDIRKVIDKKMREDILPIHTNIGDKPSDKKSRKKRQQAKKYGARTIFDLRKPHHGELIEKVLVFMAHRSPAPFINSDMEPYTTEDSDIDLGSNLGLVSDSDMDTDKDSDMDID